MKFRQANTKVSISRNTYCFIYYPIKSDVGVNRSGMSWGSYSYKFSNFYLEIIYDN
jgi:hypothetical protein